MGQTALLEDHCDPVLCEFLRLLLKALPHDDAESHCSDPVLVNGLLALEEVCGDLPGSEWRVSDVQAAFEAERCDAANAAKDALGFMWMEALLARSTNVSWNGGPSVRCEPPKPKCAIQDLAEMLAGIALDPMAGLSADNPDEWPPALLVRGHDSQSIISDTMNGIYVVDGEHHGMPTFRRSTPIEEMAVWLYYFDDRDEESQRGWWFGPQVAGDEVWAHHRGSSGKAGPPFAGYKFLVEGIEKDPYFVVVDCSATGTNIKELFKSADIQRDEAEDEPMQDEQESLLAEDHPCQSLEKPDTPYIEPLPELHSTIAKVATPQQSRSLQKPGEESPLAIGYHLCENFECAG
jgi:hypothetical protein